MVAHQLFAFSPLSRNLPSRWARRVLFPFTVKFIGCLAKQIAGDGA